MKTTVKIYTAFSSTELFRSTGTYPLHHPDEKVLSNEEMLSEVRRRCEGVEFVGTTEVGGPARTVANVQAQSLDGLLYFGSLSDEMTQLGLPTVAVYPLWGQWQEPFNSYKGSRVLTATLPVIPDASESVFSSRLDAIAEKIRLLQAVARMKGLRVLCITDRPALGEYEPTIHQTAEEGREDYEKKYLENLAELGAEIVARPQREMVSRLEEIPEAQASRVADKWIAGAEDVRGTNETEIRKSAKLYLAMREMMDDYDADAITTEGYGIFMYYEDGPIPSQGLPSSQFKTDGVVATSETLVDSLVTQQLGLWVTGSTGFNGDYIVDVENDKVYIGHCECPLNPYGDEWMAPYVIRNLPQWPVEEQEKGGACVQVKLPTDEPVTVAKVSVHDEKMALFTGRSVAGEELFPGWEDILCRTKLAIDVDAEKLFEHLDWWTFGNHRVVFYGEHSQAFKDLATLLGYEVVEEDE
ncbi:MAG: hypothetical protein U9Q78_04810 [Chloroflexota bacterium]|nr:hypothetical protein [Chloroflexota bacterium]